MIFSDKEVIELKVANAVKEKTNTEYCVLVEEKISMLLELCDTLHKENIPVGERTWIEPLIFKLCLHASSFINVFNGIKVNANDKTLHLFDEPTALVLFRTIIENYLTIFYLFFDTVSDEEKIYRLNVWKYSGISQRIGFTATLEKNIRQKEHDQKEFDRIKKVIIESPFFLSEDKKRREKILSGSSPKLFFSWKNLIQRSKLKESIFLKLYGYKSNYTHSEFISIFQIKSKGFGYNPLAKEHYTLLLAHSLISKCIIELANLFPSIKAHFDTKNSAVKYEVEFLGRLITSL